MLGFHRCVVVALEVGAFGVGMAAWGVGVAVAVVMLDVHERRPPRVRDRSVERPSTQNVTLRGRRGRFLG